jgi:TM2 domain-containing membrane protein YozV
MLVAFLAMTYGRGDLEPYEGQEVAAVENISDRSRALALALGLCGGVLGLHRFYAGRPQSAVWMILTLGGLGVWWMYDLVLLAAGEFRDANDRRIRRWHVQDLAVERGRGGGGGRIDQLAGQVDRLERDVAELAERLDFAERMLAQHRDRDRLAKP